MTTMHLLVIDDSDYDDSDPKATPVGVYPSDQAARLALADLVINGPQHVRGGQVVPIEVEIGETHEGARYAVRLAGELAAALGVKGSAFTWADLLAEVRRLVELAGGGPRVDLARRQGDALREALGVRADATFDTMIAEVEALVDGVGHQLAHFEIPDQPPDVRTVWGFNGNTGNAEQWQVDDPIGERKWYPIGEVETGTLGKMPPFSWFELLSHYGSVTSKDPNA